RTHDPECIRIENEVKNSDMDENRCQEAPILSLVDQPVGFDSKGEKSRIVSCTAGDRHEKKDRNVDSEEDVREYRAPRPNGVQKMEICFADHCLKSCCNFSAISRAAARALSNSPGLNEIAATTACPPPPYCSQSFARLWRRSRGDHGLVPTDTLARNGDWLTP